MDLDERMKDVMEYILRLWEADFAVSKNIRNIALSNNAIIPKHDNMILVKQVGVYVNILNCRLKKYLAEIFKKNNVNLTAEQYLVMDALWNEGTLTQQAIAFIIQKDKNSVTQFIDNLEKKGLVARSVAKEDRRVNNIVVTEAGMALKDSTKQLAIDTMNKALEDISETDLQTFVSVLKKVCANISDSGKKEEEMAL